jgi:phage-related protein
MANQVNLTFGGDPAGAQKAFADVGGSAKKMQGDVEESANGFEKVGGSADGAERNLIGVHDVIDGTATIMKGPGKDGIVAYIQGWADLAGGIAPLFESLAKTKVATLAQSAASKVAAVSTNLWTGATKLLSLAFISTPIGWIVLGIAALVAIVVLIATKTTWFQTIWRVAWSGIKSVASNTWDFIKKIPGWIGSAFSSIGRAVSAPFRAGFNAISDAWNNTVGGLSFTVPNWVPGLGGHSFGVPRLPHFHSGGVVPGLPGQAVPILALGGERLDGVGGSSGSPITVKAGDALVAALLDQIKQEVIDRGGSPSEVGIRIG